MIKSDICHFFNHTEEMMGFSTLGPNPSYNLWNILGEDCIQQSL